MLSISIVSHNQIELVRYLLDDLEKHCRSLSFEVLLTINTRIENLESLEQYPYPIVVIKNNHVLGFGQNHNQAFLLAKGDFFCVLNPDIRFYSDPFSNLINILVDESIGVAAPLVLDGCGRIEASARKYPNPFSIIAKLIKLNFQMQYPLTQTEIYPDWVAGMFMIFRSEVFRKINGFDERYFLYYEDVDICARLALAGKIVILSTISQITHFAQRRSHRSWQYFRWHIKSMLSFFLSKAYWRLLWR
jgi:GT2 family glycosyltransferase